MTRVEYWRHWRSGRMRGVWSVALAVSAFLARGRAFRVWAIVAMLSPARRRRCSAAPISRWRSR
jgi:hypothetical protein